MTARYLCVVAAVLAASCSSPEESRVIHPDILVVLPNAQEVKYTSDYDGTVSYELAVAYPAADVISEIRTRLEKTDWKAAPDDMLNPGQQNSHVRGWTSFVDGTRNDARVYQWTAAWDSPRGDRVEYWLKYVYPKDSGPSVRAPLKVVGLYFTAQMVERFRQR